MNGLDQVLHARKRGLYILRFFGVLMLSSAAEQGMEGRALFRAVDQLATNQRGESLRQCDRLGQLEQALPGAVIQQVL